MADWMGRIVIRMKNMIFTTVTFYTIKDGLVKFLFYFSNATLLIFILILTAHVVDYTLHSMSVIYFTL